MQYMRYGQIQSQERFLIFKTSSNLRLTKDLCIKIHLLKSFFVIYLESLIVNKV